MKMETVVANYAVPSAPLVGTLEAILSPDGWGNTMYVSSPGMHLRSEEVSEFSNFLKSFFHECPTQNDLRKFCKKNGTDTDAVTSSFRFECALMTYIVHVTGYSVVFLPYRTKED